jgi:hypothetical protein
LNALKKVAEGLQHLQATEDQIGSEKIGLAQAVALRKKMPTVV